MSIFAFVCECGLSGGINCTKEEAVEFKCPRCSLPIGRPIEIDDRIKISKAHIALEARRVYRIMQGDDWK